MFLLKQGYERNSVTLFIPGFKNRGQTTVFILSLWSLWRNYRTICWVFDVRDKIPGQ